MNKRISELTYSIKNFKLNLSTLSGVLGTAFGITGIVKNVNSVKEIKSILANNPAVSVDDLDTMFNSINRNSTNSLILVLIGIIFIINSQKSRA